MIGIDDIHPSDFRLITINSADIDARIGAQVGFVTEELLLEILDLALSDNEDRPFKGLI